MVNGSIKLLICVLVEVLKTEDCAYFDFFLFISYKQEKSCTIGYSVCNKQVYPIVRLVVKCDCYAHAFDCG